MIKEELMRVLIFSEEDRLVAQCLDRDICVQGANIDELQERFEATVILEGDFLSSLPPAPTKFHALWAEACAVHTKVQHAEMRKVA